MTRTALVISVFFLCSMTGSLVLAASPLGKALHDQYCLRCHKTEVYKRKHRRVLSLGMLQSRVQTCYQVTGARWTDGQIRSVVNYLNRSFYRFPAGR